MPVSVTLVTTGVLPRKAVLAWEWPGSRTCFTLFRATVVVQSLVGLFVIQVMGAVATDSAHAVYIKALHLLVYTPLWPVYGRNWSCEKQDAGSNPDSDY